eukprot:Hpha_TRINITY_DN16438_c1_g1::TRINITY_DN16438_c1_g1_i1::g.160341::m.160341
MPEFHVGKGQGEWFTPFWYAGFVIIISVGLAANKRMKFAQTIDNEVLQKVNEIVKLVTFFTLVLSPGSLTEYTCSSNRLFEAGVLSTGTVPLGDFYCDANWTAKLGNGTAGRQAARDMCDIKDVVKSHTYTFYCWLLFFEALTLAFMLLNFKDLMPSKTLTFIAMCSGHIVCAISWALYQIAETIEEGDVSCQLGWTFVICPAFSMLYLTLFTSTIIGRAFKMEEVSNMVVPMNS